MKNPRLIFKELLRHNPYQPATHLWRAVELDAVQQHGLPGKRALDLGCGDGKLTRVLYDSIGLRDQVWVGLDLDPEEASQAQASGFYAQVHTASATAIPEADASFDLVFSNSVLEHIPPLPDVLKEVSRVLRLGGRAVFTVPNDGFHACLHARGLTGAAAQPYYDEIDRRCAHIHYWSKDTWREQLGRVGLTLEAAQPYLNEQQTQRWERISAFTGGLAYRLAGRRRRPIEIQRMLRLRSQRPGLLGQLVAAGAAVFHAGCELDAQAVSPSARHACYLICAFKPAI